MLLGWNTSGRLADDFEQPDESKSQQAIGIQIATTASAHELNDFVSMVTHLPKAYRWITPRHTDPRPPQAPGCGSSGSATPACADPRSDQTAGSARPEHSGLQLVYAIGPRATPTVDGDRVYVLGAMGNLLALDVSTGRVLWQKDYVTDFNTSIPSWGITGAPLVDGDRLICLVGGEPDAKVMALDKRTGEEIWRSLSSDTEPGYNQPIIFDVGGVRQLIIFHPTGFSSLNPATGKVYWEIEHRSQMGIVVATPVRSGPYLFFTSQYGGARMLRLDDGRPAASLLWSGPGEQDRGMTHDTPNTLNSVISTPVISDGYVYGIDNDGQLRCLDAATGTLMWKTDALLKEHAMYGTAFFVRNGERFFINNDRGELVMATLSPKGFNEIGRTKLVEPTHPYVRRRQLPNVLWSHPAYANRHIVIRNDEEIVRFSLASGS